MGDFISQARGRALQSWNAATLNDAVAPVGGVVTKAGHDGVAEAGDILSQAYKKGTDMLGGFTLDKPAMQGITNLESGVENATNLTDQGKKAISNMVGLVKQQVSPNGTILADGFKEIDSKLNQEIAKYSGSSDVYQRGVGDALKQLQSVITDNAKRANPEAAKLLDGADQGWAKLVRIEGAAKAAASNKSNPGTFTPGQLLSSVRANDQSVRDRATARGDALMQKWAQDGVEVLGDKVPNSGTFDRGANGAALVGLATNPQYIAPAAAAVGATGALYSTPGQKLAVALTTNRGDRAKLLAEKLRNMVPTP
jgi:hypothetical protein